MLRKEEKHEKIFDINTNHIIRVASVYDGIQKH